MNQVLQNEDEEEDTTNDQSNANIFQERINHLPDNEIHNNCSEYPRTALAMVEIDEYEIHPINIFCGKRIGQGFTGNVYKSQVRESALRKLKDTISDLFKHQNILAAVKILKGL